jgi:nitrate reductase delta subunit
LNKPATFGFVRKEASDDATAERVRAWTRARFALGEEETVMVAEVACAVPGCPPLETVIAFWTEGDRRHHFKVFKPLPEVSEDDLPPAWLKNGLADSEGAECSCC